MRPVTTATYYQRTDERTSYGDYICPACGRGYRTKQTLKRHQKTVHLNIRDFQCPLCFRRFGHNFHLQSHLLHVHQRQHQQQQQQQQQQQPG
ncbi:longitudinals lacking protein, isoforms A/B/D/L-like [Tubulanus polymorphus]|uniref:longitudinals lacking protein, isoforms A/B/D/L-like n=1 Tax=Tubulanus polymorphus TaxID=672921 RepID=UPI003DA594F0